MPRRRLPLFRLIGLTASMAPISSRAASDAGRPVMRSFGSPEVHSQGPVVGFAETSDGCLFIGSNRLVVFDGLRSQRIDVPGAYAFRALAVAPAIGLGTERVWVGAAGAIGYAERDRFGTWRFVTLAPQLQAAGLSQSGEIDFTAAVGSGAVFVRGHRVQRWDGAHFEQWNFPNSGPRLQAFADDGGTVWIAQMGIGLLRLGAAGPPTLVVAASLLPPAPIWWLLRPRAVIPMIPSSGGGNDLSAGGMLAGTSAGIYQITDRGGERLTALSDLVAGQGAYLGAPADRGEIAIGTQKNGLWLARLDGSSVSVVNHRNGLADDTVYAVWFDRRAGLWVGLDNGCARLDSVGAVSLFDSREGLERGLPHKTIASGGRTYVLTDRVLYRLVSGDPTARLAPVLNGDPLLADAIEGPGGLWVGGSNGLQRVSDPMGAEILAAGNVGRLGIAPWLFNGLVFTNELGIRGIVRGSSGGWSTYDFGLKTNNPPLSLLIDRGGDVWLSTAADGIYRFHPLPAIVGQRTRLVQTAHFRESDGLPQNAARPALSELGTKIYAFTESQVLVFDGAGRFAPVPEMSDRIVLAATGAQAGSPGSAFNYWLTQRRGLSDAPLYDFLRVNSKPRPDGSIAWEPLRVGGLDNLGEITSLDLTAEPGSPIAWVGGQGGLLRINLVQIKPAGPPRALEMREVKTDAPGDDLLELVPIRPVTIGPGVHRIQFGFSAAQPVEPASLDVYYETRLLGIESGWSAPDRKNTREFTGLAPGEYVFMVRRLDRHGLPGDPLRYPFTIMAPWYLRWPALAGYALALILAGVGLFRWRLHALHRQTVRLDRLVASRTRELELSNTAKSEFLENISHEIRNPLNGIVGLVNLLKPDRLAREDREVALSLQASAEHLRRVSEDVLGFSKLEFGYITLEEKPFALGRALHEVAALYTETARQQRNVLTLTLPPVGPDCFVGDEAKIRTIVGNFVSNALKYAPGTRVKLQAEWTDEADGSAHVFITVTDHGPGIPAAEQELIFQKFVRGSNAKEGAVIGSGIGLATCRTLARRMGGAVGVESPASAIRSEAAAAPGTTFHLWLPLRRTAVSGQAADSLPAQAGSDIAHRKELGCALIVDDEPYNRVVMAGLTREIGYAPVAAADRAGAISALRTQPAEVIFLDLELRGDKGEDVAQALRALPDGNRPVIIATTGQDSEEARGRCTEAGMDGFLLKPFTAQQAREVIAQVLAKRAGSAVLAASFPTPHVPADAPASPARAFNLYALGDPEKLGEAARRFCTALKQEVIAIEQGLAVNDRISLHSAGHRLRTLGALVRAGNVNHLAARLQTTAANAEAADLFHLAAELIAATERLQNEIVTTLGAAPPNG